MTFYSMKIQGNTIYPYDGDDILSVNFYTKFPCSYDLSDDISLQSIDLMWWLNCRNSVSIYLGLSTLSHQYIYSAYHKDNGNTLYHGEDGCGFAHTFNHIPGDEFGYASRTFNLIMKDGTKKTIKGPWDDGLLILDEYKNKPYFEVIVYDGDNCLAGRWCIPPLSEIVVKHLKRFGVCLDIMSSGRLTIDKGCYVNFLGSITDFPSLWSKHNKNNTL